MELYELTNLLLLYEQISETKKIRFIKLSDGSGYLEDVNGITLCSWSRSSNIATAILVECASLLPAEELFDLLNNYLEHIGDKRITNDPNTD